MAKITPEQESCGYAQNGYPALCTCGTCDWVDEGCGCIWCDLGFTPKPRGFHETAKGKFPCTNQNQK